MSNKHKRHQNQPSPSRPESGPSHDQAHEGGADDTKVRFSDDEGNTETRDPKPPVDNPAPQGSDIVSESDSDEYPEPSGTDTGTAHKAVAAPAGSGASASTAVGAGTEHDVDDDNFDKETGFFTDDKKKS